MSERLTDEHLDSLEHSHGMIESEYTPTCRSARYGNGCPGATDDSLDFWRRAADAVPAMVAELRERRRADRAMNALSLVAEFHRVFGQVIAAGPNVSDREISRLRLRLLAEEVCELAEALGFKLEFTEIRDDLSTSKVDALDALTDIEYVLAGAWLSLGFHAMRDDALAEVHRSNLSKLGPDGNPVLREDGKVTKGPNYEPPNLKAVYEKHVKGGR